MTTPVLPVMYFAQSYLNAILVDYLLICKFRHPLKDRSHHKIIDTKFFLATPAAKPAKQGL